MRYAFIGLGHLGRHLAMNLLRGGFALSVHDLDRSSASALEAAGARWAEEPAEAVSGCDALVTCLPSPAASARVLGVALPAMQQGSTWIEMSTNDAPLTEALAAQAEAHG